MRAQDTTSQRHPGQERTCIVRQDDRGAWNSCKAWHWYPLHLCLCVGFIVVLFTLVDDHVFKIASPLGFSERKFELYQAEVTGLVSAVLVLIRLIAEVGSALIVWRLVFILLEKSGITLTELCRMVDLRVLIKPGFGSVQEACWSFFTIIILLLVWPSSIAAPLANSSLQWIPSTRSMRSEVRNYTVPDIQKGEQWVKFFYQEDIAEIALRAATMGVKDPNYAFSATQSSQRRYVYLSPRLPSGGTATVPMPYFEVSEIKWMAESDQFTQDPSSLSNASMLENPPLARRMGTLGFLMSEKWDYSKAIKQYGQSSVLYEGKRNVSILVGRIGHPNSSPEVDEGTNTTICPSTTRPFGILPPNTNRYPADYLQAKEWAATDCYLIAEVTMKIGKISNQDCDIKLAENVEDTHIIIPTNQSQATRSALEPDRLVLPTLDMMTDVLRQLVLLGVGGRSQFNNTAGYLAGMLAVAYHTTYSALLVQATDSNATIIAVPLEPVVRASVNKSRLYVWLALNATLSVAAAFLLAVRHMTAVKSKVVREPTLVALTMDMNAVCHRDEHDLCNAIALDESDRKLGKMVWDDCDGASCRRVCFRSQVERDDKTTPLLS